MQLKLDSHAGNEILRGKLGLDLPKAAVLRKTASCHPAAGAADVCYKWGDHVQLHLTAPTGADNCARLEWSTGSGGRLEDCFNLEPHVHW